MKQLYFITGNIGKLAEIQERVKTLDIKVIQKDLGYPEIQVETLEDVAEYGVKHIQKQFNEPFILEDAGLFIDDLDGFPGVYSKYVFYTIGLKGILKLMENTTKRSALFRSVYAYAEPNSKPILFVGECKGTITIKERGTGGFGYDPLFIPDGESKTFAEMSREEKNRYSHRGKAVDKLFDFLKKQNDTKLREAFKS